MHRQQAFYSERTGSYAQRSWVAMHTKHHLKVAWAVYKSYGPASSPTRNAAIWIAASAAASRPQPQPSTTSELQTTDIGLEVFKALIAEKRFICTQCGKCCTGDGEVWISDDEAVKIAKHLNLPLKRFLAQHTRGYSKVEGFRILKSDMHSENRNCTFLQPDNTCAIHAARPLQCSTYPWWPDLMDDKEWSWEKENVCEGFDHPDALPTDVTEAARQLKSATIQEYQKRLAYKPSKKQQKAAATGIAASVAGVSDSRHLVQDARQGDEHTLDELQRAESSSSAGTSSTPSWQTRLENLRQLTQDSS